MSEIKVNSIKGVGASTAAITVNNTDGTCTANLSNRQNRNLIINGAMEVAQRGTTSTSNGYQTVDRFYINFANTDEAPTQAQADVASGTTPYTLGFRKSFKITNGNQTSGAGAADRMRLLYIVEAQDLAKSGWNYTDANSKITLSFWIKSSVSQNFYFRVATSDGTSYNFPMETGVLTADTWTKVTKTISGNSNLTFNNDNGIGLYLSWAQYRGTDNTDSGVALNTWTASGSGYTLFPDYTSTWYTTNDATWELTGVQLEVGSVATDFEHRSFADELRRCQRYYFILADASGGTNEYQLFNIHAYSVAQVETVIDYSWANLRAVPSLIQGAGTNYFSAVNAGNTSILFGAFLIYQPSKRTALLYQNSLSSAPSTGQAYRCQFNNVAAYVAFDAEL